MSKKSWKYLHVIKCLSLCEKGKVFESKRASICSGSIIRKENQQKVENTVVSCSEVVSVRTASRKTAEVNRLIKPLCSRKWMNDRKKVKSFRESTNRLLIE